MLARSAITQRKMSSKFIAFVLLASLILSFLLYGNTTSGGFVYDDSLFLSRNDLRGIGALVKVWGEPYLPNHIEAGAWRPLSTFITAVQLHFIGDSPSTFHLRNIVLYGLLIFFAFLLIYELFRSIRFAFLTAVLFAFFPVHTEAVSSIKSGEDLFGMFFFLLAWIFYLHAVRNESINYRIFILSSISLLASFLSKETYIFGPILILATYMMQGKRSFHTLHMVGILYGAVMAIYLFWRHGVLGQYAFGAGDESFVINPIRYTDVTTRIWTAFSICLYYIRAILLPLKLTASYHYNHVPLVHNPIHSWQALVGIVLIGALLYLILSNKRKSKQLTIGALTFLIPYLVVSKFIFTGGEIMAERWMLMPSLGIAILGGYALEKIAHYQKLFGLIVLLSVLAWYASIIVPRNAVWLSNRALIESMVKDSPNSVQAHYLLADMYFADGNLSGAQEHSSIANSIYPDYAPLLTLRGSILGQEGKYQDAKLLFLRSAKLDPKHVLTFRNLAIAFYLTGEYEKANNLYSEMIPKSYGRLSLKDFTFYASSLTKSKRYQESTEIIKRYIQDESIPEIRYLLAVNYYRSGNIDKAKQYFDWNPNMSFDQKIAAIKVF